VLRLLVVVLVLVLVLVLGLALAAAAAAAPVVVLQPEGRANQPLPRQEKSTTRVQPAGGLVVAGACLLRGGLWW